MRLRTVYSFFFFNDTATTEIYTLSLHDALPIFSRGDAPDRRYRQQLHPPASSEVEMTTETTTPLIEVQSISKYFGQVDRKSTRLNSSHANISYAVFCLKKKKNIQHPHSIYPYHV